MTREATAGFALRRDETRHGTAAIGDDYFPAFAHLVEEFQEILARLANAG